MHTVFSTTLLQADETASDAAAVADNFISGSTSTTLSGFGLCRTHLSVMQVELGPGRAVRSAGPGRAGYQKLSPIKALALTIIRVAHP